MYSTLVYNLYEIAKNMSMEQVSIHIIVLYLVTKYWSFLKMKINIRWMCLRPILNNHRLKSFVARSNETWVNKSSRETWSYWKLTNHGWAPLIGTQIEDFHSKLICHFLSLNRTCNCSLSFGKQVHYHM